MGQKGGGAKVTAALTSASLSYSMTSSDSGAAQQADMRRGSGDWTTKRTVSCSVSDGLVCGDFHRSAASLSSPLSTSATAARSRGRTCRAGDGGTEEESTRTRLRSATRRYRRGLPLCAVGVDGTSVVNSGAGDDEEWTGIWECWSGRTHDKSSLYSSRIVGANCRNTGRLCH